MVAVAQRWSFWLWSRRLRVRVPPATHMMIDRTRGFFAKEEKTLPPHEKPAQERLLEEIRDLLQKQK